MVRAYVRTYVQSARGSAVAENKNVETYRVLFNVSDMFDMICSLLVLL